MKYSMVKQFSNGAADNFFNFFYKIVDFGKILIDVFWAFFDIWAAFYLIFFNIFMYIYYFGLFIVERFTVTQRNIFLIRRGSQKTSKIPDVIKKKQNISIPKPSISKKIPTVITKSSNISKTVAAKVSNTVKSIPTPNKITKTGAKKSIFKSIAKFIENLINNTFSFITKPFIIIGKFFMAKSKPIKEKTSFDESKSSSLISEYLKEYEKGK